MIAPRQSNLSEESMNIFRHFTSNRTKGAIYAPESTIPLLGGGASGNPIHNDTNSTQTTDKEIEQREKKRSNLEDVELVKKAQSGDTKAFDQLVTKHRAKIYAMIVKMVKNDTDAWDLSQEAFLKAWRALPKFEARAQFSTWLFRISHNVVYDWMRKRRIESEGELNDEIFDANRIDPGARATPQQHARPDEAMAQSERRQEINSAIAKLSPNHREVILLREVQGLDYKEIAAATGASMGTIMSRLHHARKKLQSLLPQFNPKNTSS